MDRSGQVRPVLIGEVNPFGGDEGFALYPLPLHCSGDRLCRLIMGLEHSDYLKRFERVNLCRGRWSLPKARKRATSLLAEYPAPIPFVLLGQKVATAFCGIFDPFTWHTTPGTLNRKLIILPHPSGLNRMWSVPGNFTKARSLLRETGVLSSSIGD